MRNCDPIGIMIFVSLKKGLLCKSTKQILDKEWSNLIEEDNQPSAIVSPNKKYHGEEKRVREVITIDEAEQNINELTKVPEDLQDVLPRPDQIWNCDEVGIDPNGKWHKIVCTYKWCKNEKVWRTQDGEKAPFWVTFLFFTRADGQCFVPCTVVHQASHTTLAHASNLPSNWVLHTTPSGYMDRDGWFKTVKKFTEYVHASEGEPLFLFFDGHDSHWDPDALDLLHKNNIESFFLQSQISQNDQPNDNGPNACFKACYNETKEELHEMFGTETFNVPHMNMVLRKSWERFTVRSPTVIKNAFRKTKLCPLLPPLTNTDLSSLV